VGDSRPEQPRFERLEFRPMIHLFEMRDFVGSDVSANIWGRENQSPT